VNSGAPANRPAESAHAVSSAPRSIGLARSYAELQRIVADYCEHTAMTRAELDAEAGIADGNSSKALARPARKRLGWVTLGRVLGAAGLALHVVIDPDTPQRDLNASSSASRERYSHALAQCEGASLGQTPCSQARAETHGHRAQRHCPQGCTGAMEPRKE
jgi:hypothetical protein